MGQEAAQNVASQPARRAAESAGAAEPVKRGFGPRFRLKLAADFERAYQRRRPVSDDRLLIFACENGGPDTRLGLSVSRKLGGAVKRNRWKRLLREAFRLRRSELPAGIDLVVIPRASEPPTLAELQASLVCLAARAARKLTEKPA